MSGNERGGLEQRCLYTLFVLIQPDMHGWRDCKQSGHVWPISHRLTTSTDHYSWWIYTHIQWWEPDEKRGVLHLKCIHRKKKKKKNNVKIPKGAQGSCLSLHSSVANWPFAICLCVCGLIWNIVRWPKVREHPKRLADNKHQSALVTIGKALLCLAATIIGPLV